jgi:hypothetical protein
MTIEQRLMALVKDAWEQGITVTVDQCSLPPYAMGHYYTRIAARPSNQNASSIMLIKIDSDGYGGSAQRKTAS